MIKLNYPGRMGNNMFLYAFSRLVSEATNLKMVVNSGEFENHQYFKNAVYTGGVTRESDVVVLSGESNADDLFELAIKDANAGKGLFLHGYFQNYKFYLPHRDLIKDWFKLPDVQGINDNDVIVHIRREDYLESNSQLSIDYYFEILDSYDDQRDFDRLTIVGKDIEPWFVQKFRDRYETSACRIEQPKLSSIDEFNMIRNHSRIVCSNSTFAWWAAFLSNAVEIFAPLPEVGYWSSNSDQKLLSSELFKIVYNDNRR